MKEGQEGVGNNSVNHKRDHVTCPDSETIKGRTLSLLNDRLLFRTHVYSTSSNDAKYGGD